MESMNPARELLAIFRSWESSREQDAEDQLRLDAEENQELALRATRCLRDIKTILDYMNQTEMQEFSGAYRDAYTDWFKTVFHYPRQWRGERFNIREDRLLQALIGQIDLLGGISPARTGWIRKHSDLLNEKLREVLQILIEDTSLDSAFRAHAERLIVHVMEILKNLDRANSFELSEALLLLRTYMDSANVRTSDESNRGHYSWFSTFISHPLTNTFFGWALNSGTQAVPRAIEM